MSKLPEGSTIFPKFLTKLAAMGPRPMFYLWFLLQMVIFIVYQAYTDKSLTEMIYFWDSSWYAQIVLYGYSKAEFGAFLPLYPNLLKWAYLGLGGRLEVGVVGSVLSLGLFAVAFGRLLPAWLKHVGPEKQECRWAHFFFLFAPASYVFHTNHTEGLFLFLSLACFLASEKKNIWLAVIAAALCIWTRHQGLFVAFVAGLIFLRQGSKKGFVWVGVLTSLAFASLLWRNQFFFGDWLWHFHQQAHWQNDTSVWHPVLALFFMNQTQLDSMNLGRLVHGVIFYLFFIASFFIPRKQWPYMVYAFLSLFAVIKQGEFSNAFRFLGVVFPTFYLAHSARVSSHLLQNRGLQLGLVVVALVYLALHSLVWINYLKGRWAY